MVSKRAYSRVKVKSVDVDQLIAKAKDVAQISLGLDIGKLEIVACLRWSQGQFERPWSVNNPFEINALVDLCVETNKVVKVVVAMESTGTYGDAVRRALGNGSRKKGQSGSQKVCFGSRKKGHLRPVLDAI